MSLIAKIRIQWLENPPAAASIPGWRLSAPARFDHQDESWRDNAWSVAIVVDGVPDPMGEQSATAAFLSSDAPQKWLAQGKTFTLYADRPMARGFIESVADE